MLKCRPEIWAGTISNTTQANAMPRHTQRPDHPIPRNDWDRSPWNRWSFQHMRELLPTTEVWRGSGPTWTLPTAKQSLDHLTFTDHQSQSTSIQQWLDTSFTDGFIVLHHGTIVFERYMNGMHDRSLHLSQSVAKSVTSVLAGVLSGKGMLDPAALVTDYLPELQDTAWQGATLRQVLDMSTGVRFNEEYEAADSDIAMTDIASGWKMPPAGLDAPATIWQQILGLTESARPHGESFNYRSIETDVLAHCIERVTGMRMSDVLSQEVWAPMGAENNACFTVDSVGYALADGGFNASLRDYARIGQMLANGGVANGRQIVPWDWIADIVSGAAIPLGKDYEEVFPGGGYRSKFWLPAINGRVFMALGVFGQWIYVNLEHDVVCVKLSSWPEFLSTPRKLDCMAAIASINRHLATE